jgi:hypothetical protein
MPLQKITQTGNNIRVRTENKDNVFRGSYEEFQKAIENADGGKFIELHFIIPKEGYEETRNSYDTFKII